MNVPSSRGGDKSGLIRKGTVESEIIRNASADDVEDEDEDDAPPKYFKGSQVKNVLT